MQKNKNSSIHTLRKCMRFMNDEKVSVRFWTRFEVSSCNEENYYTIPNSETITFYLFLGELKQT